LSKCDSFFAKIKAWCLMVWCPVLPFTEGEMVWKSTYLIFSKLWGNIR
jgi:hypothetical protein